MSGIRSVGAGILWLFTLVGSETSARELWRSGDAYLDAGGSLREIAMTTRGTSAAAFGAGFTPACVVTPTGDPASPDTFADCPAFDVVGDERVMTSITRLRIRAEGRADEHWSANISADGELWAGDLDSFESEFGREFRANSFMDASGEVGESPSFHYSLYRAHINFESQYFEAVIGRQRIPWGVGRLWNPIDRFNAIRPLATEPDQSPGVDAVDARILFSGFSQLELVFAPKSHAGDHDYAARLQGVLADVDYGLVVGVFDKATTAGLDLASNLGDAAGRLEIVYTHPTREIWPVRAGGPSRLEDFWQIVLSVDYNVDWGSGLYLLAEHLYNGNALGFGSGKAGTLLPLFERTNSPPYYEAVSANRFGGSQVITFSSQLTGLQAGYQITPELGVNGLIIYDWEGESAVFFPSLTYNPLAWLDLTLGLQAGVGQDASEYGGVPVTAYLLVDAYF